MFWLFISGFKGRKAKILPADTQPAVNNQFLWDYWDAALLPDAAASHAGPGGSPAEDLE